MARIPFRQGLVRYQTDLASTPTFLQAAGSQVNLNVSPTPTVITFAHKSTDYLFEERTSVAGAWQGPFSPGTTDYWLYWDIDLVTGERTFGHTTLEPVYGPVAPAPVNTKHWFDTTNKVMKVWNGVTWQEVIRCFAGKYDNGSIIVANPTGTQVGLSQVGYAGFILFDENDNPIRKFSRSRQSEFITTESVLITHLSTGAVSFTFETALNLVEAVGSIPAYYLVSPRGEGQIGLASHTDVARPIIGIVREDLVNGATGSFVPRGYVTNENWNWTVSPGTPLFCGVSGQVTTSVPQIGAIQEIGYVVSSKTIFVDIQHAIRLGV